MLFFTRTCAVMFIAVPLLVIIMGWLKNSTVGFESQIAKSYAKAGDAASESFSNIRTVLAYGGAASEVERYDSHLESAQKSGEGKGFAVGMAVGSMFGCVTYITVFLRSRREEIAQLRTRMCDLAKEPCIRSRPLRSYLIRDGYTCVYSIHLFVLLHSCPLHSLSPRRLMFFLYGLATIVAGVLILNSRTANPLCTFQPTLAGCFSGSNVIQTLMAVMIGERACVCQVCVRLHGFVLKRVIAWVGIAPSSLTRLCRVHMPGFVLFLPQARLVWGKSAPTSPPTHPRATLRSSCTPSLTVCPSSTSPATRAKSPLRRR